MYFLIVDINESHISENKHEFIYHQKTRIHWISKVEETKIAHPINLDYGPLISRDGASLCFLSSITHKPWQT